MSKQRQIFVKPRPGCTIIDPNTGRALKPEGEVRSNAPHWKRFKRLGEAEVTYVEALTCNGPSARQGCAGSGDVDCQAVASERVEAEGQTGGSEEATGGEEGREAAPKRRGRGKGQVGDVRGDDAHGE